MRRQSFLIYLLLQILVIVSVLVIFKVIPDRQIAATCAGILFVEMPLVVMFLEFRQRKLEYKWWFAGVLQFWLPFALPILGLRVLNWGVPFEELSFLGVPGPVLHQWSSKSYMVMMLFTIGAYWKSLQNKKAG